VDKIAINRPSPSPSNKRTASRRTVQWPARLTWKDQRGTTRFASVIARNVSDSGVYVESHTVVSIPLYRLVQFQLEREVSQSEELPEPLAQGRVLTAVYRISAATPSGKRQGFALRLMVTPKRRVSGMDASRAVSA